jgi:hypothetical protein
MSEDRMKGEGEGEEVKESLLTPALVTGPRGPTRPLSGVVGGAFKYVLGDRT